MTKVAKKNGKLVLHLKKNALHEDLGVPAGEKIPASKLAVKSTDTPLEVKRKTFAKNAAKWHH